jgi:hypothetical protein
MFLPGKGHCPYSAPTGLWHYAVPHHWCSGVLAGFISEDEIGSNLMGKVRIIGWMWHHCPFRISDGGLFGVPTCVQLSVVMEE